MCSRICLSLCRACHGRVSPRSPAPFPRAPGSVGSTFFVRGRPETEQGGAGSSLHARFRGGGIGGLSAAPLIYPVLSVHI